MRIQRIFAATISAVLLSGCLSGGEIADRAVEHNIAVADAANKLVLLNVVRASLRHPVIYTQLTGVSEQISGGPSASLSIPFGPDAFNAYSADGAFGMSGYASISTAPLEDQEFYAGVMTPLSLGDIDYYLDAGWPENLIWTLTVEDFEASAALYAEIVSASNALCARALGAIQCTRLVSGAAPRMTADGATVFLDNNPRDAQAFALFQDFLMRLELLGLSVEVVTAANELRLPSSAQLLANAEQINNLVATGASVRTEGREIVVTVPYALPVLRISGIARAGEDRVVGLTAHTRSPDAILFYLGEVAGAGAPIEVHVGGGTNARFTPLFPVHACDGGCDNTAVDVDYDGRNWAIDAENGGRAMQVIAFIHQVFGLHKRAYAPPSSNAVTVIN